MKKKKKKKKEERSSRLNMDYLIGGEARVKVDDSDNVKRKEVVSKRLEDIAKSSAKDV